MSDDKTNKVDFHAAAALIDEDVRRTFGVQSKIRNNDGSINNKNNNTMILNKDITRLKKMECLRNVLRSYICQNNDVGYCQGMDYVTSFLLEQADWNEATAFALLDMLMEERNLGEMFSVGLPGLRKSFHQFNVLMAMHAPDLTLHFEQEQIDSTMFATNWFMTLFTDYKLLPKQIVLTIFDMFVVDGWPVIMGVALAIVKEFEPYLLLLDMEGIMKFIKNVSINSQDSPIVFDSAKNLLDHALKFGITSQLLKSIAQSDMKDFVQVGFGHDDDDDDLKNKNDNNDVLLKSPSSSTITTTTTRGKDSHKMNNVVDDNINHAGNIIGNAIKKNWPPAFLSSYLKPATNKKNRHGVKKIIVNKEKVGKVQTPSSVFRSGSIFSNNDDDNINNKTKRGVGPVTRVSTPL